jgi:hypothetical protein
MTKDQLADRLAEVIFERTGVWEVGLADWIGKVEAGKARVYPDDLRDLAQALGADAIGEAVLLEAHGYNGLAVLQAKAQGDTVLLTCLTAFFEDFAGAPGADTKDQRMKRATGYKAARELVEELLYNQQMNQMELTHEVRESLDT